MIPVEAVELINLGIPVHPHGAVYISGWNVLCCTPPLSHSPVYKKPRFIFFFFLFPSSPKYTNVLWGTKAQQDPRLIRSSRRKRREQEWSRCVDAGDAETADCGVWGAELCSDEAAQGGEYTRCGGLCRRWLIGGLTKVSVASFFLVRWDGDFLPFC